MKALPVPTEAERAICGAVIANNKAVQTAKNLQPEDFGMPCYRRIWIAILATLAGGADLVSVTAHLNASGQLEAAGGHETVSATVDGIPRLTSVTHYAKIIREAASRRRLCDMAQKVHAAALDGTAEEALRMAERMTGELKGRDSGGVYSGQGLADLEEADFSRRQTGKSHGVTTGLMALDYLLAPGLQRGELWFVGARPSVGKTAFMLTVMDRALTNGLRCCHLALEMGPRRNLWRLLAIHSGVPLSLIRQPERMSETDKAAYSRAWIWIHQRENLILHDCPGASVEEVAWRIRQAKEAMGGLDLVTLDYVQLLRISLSRESSGYEARTLNAQRLAALSVEENVPFVVGSQLNRAAESDSQEDRPKLSELEGTGRIEQVASGVMLLHRWNRKVTGSQGPAEIIVAKNQDGPTGTVQASFRAACSRWENG